MWLNPNLVFKKFIALPAESPIVDAVEEGIGYRSPTHSGLYLA